MAVLVNGSEIILSGTVGDFWFEDGFTSGDVIAALAQVGDATDITVRLNSGGGIATEGSAIHAALTRHTGRKTVIVEGVAASAASVIAMAGDEIVMSLGALMMVHEPSGITFGTADDHQQMITMLNAVASAMGGIYAAKTGHREAECRADMKAELWMTPEEAVAKGYADRTTGEPANDNVEAEAVAAFDYRIYARAPKQLVALARKNDWRMTASRPAASTAPTPEQEPPMPEPKAGVQTPEAIEAARTKAADDATAKTTAHAAEIATICAEAGVPTMTATLIKEGLTVDEARARTTQAKDIKAAVDLAGKSGLKLDADYADKAIASGRSLDAVRGDLFAKITAAQSPEIASHHQPAGNAATATAKASMERQLKRAGQSKEA